MTENAQRFKELTATSTAYEMEYLNTKVAFRKTSNLVTSTPKAMVFINTQSDSSELVKDLERMDGINEAYSSKGMYDAAAMIQGESFTAVKEI